MKFLGDIIVVQHIEKHNGYATSLIQLPETARKNLGPIKARVIALGQLPANRSSLIAKRKARGVSKSLLHYFPQDEDIKVGDIVYVQQEVGSRNRVPNNPDAIIMDSEDVLGLVS